MKPSLSNCRSPHAVASAMLLIAFAAEANASSPLGFGIAQPQAYESPSGIFSLHVRPHDRWGHGSASYRWTKNGKEVWSADKAYTLRAVTTTDSGFAVGVAYREVPVERDGRPRDPKRYFHVVILNERGSEVLNDVEERLPHNIDHSHPPPYAQQLLVAPDNDRLVLRLVEGDGRGGIANRGWRIYNLSTGVLLDRFDPRERDTGVEHNPNWWVVDTRLIKGTPLIVTHWFRSATSYKKPEERAGRFTVVGGDGRPIWSYQVEGAYTDYFRKHPAVLPTNEEQHFQLRFSATSETTRYRVERDSRGDWNVSELKTKQVVQAKPSAKTASVCGELTYLGPVQLGASAAGASSFGDIRRFTFDKAGNIYFSFRDTAGRLGTRAINSSGEIIKEDYSDESSHVYVHWNDCPRVGDDQYVEIREVSKDPGEYSVTLVNLATGESGFLPGYPGGYARSIARSRDGGLAVVNDAGLARYDSSGKLLWSLNNQTRNGFRMRAKSVAFLTGEHLALLTGDEVKLIVKKSSRTHKSIDLTGAFGTTEFGGRPGSLHEVVADADGGFLLQNVRNPPVVLRYDANGALRSRWSPRFSNGRTFSIAPGIRVAPDGRLWTSDGRTFMRLTDDGVVDHTLGEAPNGDVLTELAGFTVGEDGRWYAVESGIGAVCVFDQLGRQQFVAKPRPEDFSGSVKTAHVAVNTNGEIYVQRPSTKVYSSPDEYLRFDSSGRPKEVVTFEPRLGTAPFGAGWAFQPGTGYRCGICQMRGDTRLMIVNPPDQIIRETRKRPDGKWFALQAIFAMAPDGTMAVLTAEGKNDERLYALDLFTAEAEGIRSIPLPPPTTHYTGLAYDTSHAVAVGNSKALIVRLSDDTTTEWALSSLPDAMRSWQAFFIAGGRELLLFDHWSKELHRYALP